MGIRFQQKRDTAANWTSNDPTLLSGEIGFETDTGKFKIGDGSTAWTSLDYAAGFSSKCSVYRSTTQAIPQNWSKVECATEDYDIDNEFDAVTNYRFQPSITGYYHVMAGMVIAGPADAENLIVGIYKNGVKWKSTAGSCGSTATGSRHVSADMYLLDSDYIELWAYHSASGNLNTGSTRDTFLDVHRFA